MSFRKDQLRQTKTELEVMFENGDLSVEAAKKQGFLKSDNSPSTIAQRLFMSGDLHHLKVAKFREAGLLPPEENEDHNNVAAPRLK